LPHLPSLEIREGAIDKLVRLYKDAVYKTGGFLTNSGLVNPDRVQMIMQDLGLMEDGIFKERQSRELSFRARNKSKRRREKLDNSGPKWMPRGQLAPMALGGKSDVAPSTNVKSDAFNMRREGMGYGQANQDAAKSMKAMLKSGQGEDFYHMTFVLFVLDISWMSFRS
jgi:5'-3' exoribonuclease 2